MFKNTTVLPDAPKFSKWVNNARFKILKKCDSWSNLWLKAPSLKMWAWQHRTNIFTKDKSVHELLSVFEQPLGFVNQSLKVLNLHHTKRFSDQIIFNRPEVAGAVLHTASSLYDSLIHWLGHAFSPNTQHILNPKPLVTCHMFKLRFFCGGARWWRVCHKRGLPHLVS